MSAPWDDPDPLDALGLPPEPQAPEEPAYPEDLPQTEPPIEADPAMLAAEVLALDEAVKSVSGKVASLEALITDEATGLDALNDAVGTVLDLLSGQPGGPWLWDKLSDDQRRALWFELGEWVAWFEQHYLAGLPASQYPFTPCWYRHPVAVDLLTALMVAHHATYSTKAVLPSFTLVDWHTRALIPVFEALRSMQVFTNCTEEHSEPSRGTKHDPAGFEQWVDQVAPDPLIALDQEVTA